MHALKWPRPLATHNGSDEVYCLVEVTAWSRSRLDQLVKNKVKSKVKSILVPGMVKSKVKSRVKSQVKS